MTVILDNLAKKGVITKEVPKEQTQNQIKVILDAVPVTFEVSPFITDEGTLVVPFRPIFEKLGLSIRWDEASQTIIGEKAGTKIILVIDHKFADVNGKSVEMSVAPILDRDNCQILIGVI
ncbi:copper amine oxidase N-terminal domain-containing protein [Paenibacillus sp. GYB004]|uniref:copper amine oxidase N-terminal domain-containing protein n=1 Tax=Paenibacillus sp. GYB004 TaxID=2994393 RepID=UPI002F966122